MREKLGCLEHSHPNDTSEIKSLNSLLAYAPDNNTLYPHDTSASCHSRTRRQQLNRLSEHSIAALPCSAMLCHALPCSSLTTVSLAHSILHVVAKYLLCVRMRHLEPRAHMFISTDLSYSCLVLQLLSCSWSNQRYRPHRSPPSSARLDQRSIRIARFPIRVASLPRRVPLAPCFHRNQPPLGICDARILQERLLLTIRSPPCEA